MRHREGLILKCVKSWRRPGSHDRVCRRPSNDDEYEDEVWRRSITEDNVYRRLDYKPKYRK